ncbi:MAG: glycosyltransferase family 4 protein [Hyphomicrobiales bacterium]|nr:glycosyltransferase family 4 protein [Hyphomicrobiales bacterium]
MPQNGRVILPENSHLVIRKSLNLGSKDEVRISFVTGPGDVFGTYQQWKEGRDDKRVPIITYSAMFYDLIASAKAHGQLISVANTKDYHDKEFRFDKVIRPKFSGRFSFYISQHKYAQNVIEKINLFDPQIVLVSTDFPANGWLALSQSRKLILTAHNTFWPMGQPPSTLPGMLEQYLLSRHSRHIDSAVCTSSECKRQISTLTNGRVEGYVQFPQLLKKYRKEKRQRARNLIYIGRIERNKGIFLLLNSFRALMEKYPDSTLTFVGSGRAEEELQNRIDEINDTRVRFTGRLDAKGVHNELSNCDLLVCPTMTKFNEGLAVVGIEAAAHGIPSVLSSIVPASDLLGSACKIFKADSSTDLTSTLEELMGNENAYMELYNRVLPQVGENMYDRTLSWGTQLYKAIISGD